MLIRVTICAVVLFLLIACSHQPSCAPPTDALLVGKWEALDSPGVVVFDSGHTLVWGFNDDNADGTWAIADGTLTVTLRERAEPPHEWVTVYRNPKICGERLVFGPWITSTQVSRPEERDDGVIYKRVR